MRSWCRTVRYRRGSGASRAGASRTRTRRTRAGIAGTGSQLTGCGAVWTYRARCVHVVDGDTFDLRLDLGFGLEHRRLRVRLLGADTPELRSGTAAERAEGKRVRAFVESWLTASPSEWPLTVTTAKADGFGRWLAGVHRQGDMVSLTETLIANDMAARWPQRWRDLHDGL